MTPSIDRRTFVRGGAALAIAALTPVPASAKDQLVVATFPGTWNEVHREILAPYFQKKTNADVTQTIMLATDQVAKLAATRGQPPFDVAILDEGPTLDAVKQGVLEKYPAAKSAHFNELGPPFRNEWGPAISMQAIGLAYNPKKVKTAPRSWDDLWNPAYKGRVGLTALNSSLGMAFIVELARLKGGSESNLEPGFLALRTLLPNVGAISANLGAHSALIQQEQVDVAVHNFNFIETLKGKGVEVDWVKPETGAPAWRTNLHIVKGAQRPDLAFEYIEGHITPEVQAAMAKPPHFVIPTNRKVVLSGAIVDKVARTPDEARLPRLDEDQRGARRRHRALQPGDQALVVPARSDGEWRLALPVAAFFALFFVAPLGVLFVVSLFAEPTMQTLALRQYTRFLGDRLHLGILVDTLVLGVKATLVCLLLGYPLAWVIARARPRVQSLLVFVVILPLLTSVVVRTFAWIVILGRQGILNKTLLAVGLIDEPVRLLFTEPGVVMVLAQVQLPLMILPLLTTFQRIDPHLADASAALGAGQWRTFARVIAPLSLPGVAAGCVLVYAACVTAFVTQTLIGGARLVWVPLFMYQQATGANDWPFAAAISIVFMFAVLFVVVLINAAGRGRRALVHG